MSEDQKLYLDWLNLGDLLAIRSDLASDSNIQDAGRRLTREETGAVCDAHYAHSVLTVATEES